MLITQIFSLELKTVLNVNVAQDISPDVIIVVQLAELHCKGKPLWFYFLFGVGRGFYTKAKIVLVAWLILGHYKEWKH